MKKAIVTSMLAFALASCSSSKESKSTNSFAIDTTKVEAGQPFYQCPMHPSVLSLSSGNCPECGMSLEKVIKK